MSPFVTVAIVAAAGVMLELWCLLPGLLGSIFVFASIVGYQRLGASVTIATVVARDRLLSGQDLQAMLLDHRQQLQRHSTGPLGAGFVSVQTATFFSPP
jgi:uncharacterized membrane protein YdcZ (DUF606 family)